MQAYRAGRWVYGLGLGRTHLCGALLSAPQLLSCLLPLVCSADFSAEQCSKSQQLPLLNTHCCCIYKLIESGHVWFLHPRVPTTC